ncbi:MAG TPA: acyl-CoA thioesterase [Kiritimatiellia bacterium]|nr:acyl-CoA thioesterase [Kiritimatiellia bacterium]HMP34264.1 acyl-CoA thioesterase [Kiritimatiellia bacterium]
MNHTCRVQLADTDAAGRIYFAAALRLAHEAFENAMASAGLDLRAILERKPFVLPVVRVEADYRAPLALGDAITVVSRTAAIGARSFAMNHQLRNAHGDIAVDVTITHAVVAKDTGKATDLPDQLRAVLGRI